MRQSPHRLGSAELALDQFILTGQVLVLIGIAADPEFAAAQASMPGQQLLLSARNYIIPPIALVAIVITGVAAVVLFILLANADRLLQVPRCRKGRHDGEVAEAEPVRGGAYRSPRRECRYERTAVCGGAGEEVSRTNRISRGRSSWQRQSAAVVGYLTSRRRIALAIRGSSQIRRHSRGAEQLADGHQLEAAGAEAPCYGRERLGSVERRVVDVHDDDRARSRLTQHPAHQRPGRCPRVRIPGWKVVLDGGEPVSSAATRSTRASYSP